MRPRRATLTEKPHPPTKMGYACRIFQSISLKRFALSAAKNNCDTLKKEQWQKPVHAG